MRTKYHAFGFDVVGTDLRDNSTFEDFIVKILPCNDKNTFDRRLGAEGAQSEVFEQYQRLGYDHLEVHFVESFEFDSMDLYLELREAARGDAHD